MMETDPVRYPELRIVELETYSRCNRACTYCPNSLYKRKPFYMPLPIIMKLLRILADMHFQGQFSFHFYNEPLLDKRIAEIVDNTRKYLPDAFLLMYTNGDFLTYEYFKQLIHLGIDKFLVTRQEGVPPSCFLAWRHRLSEREKEYLFYQDFKHPGILYTNRGGLLPGIENPAESLAVPCVLPCTSVAISAYGNVLLCFEDYNETMVMGNVFNTSIKDIWYGRNYIPIREKLLKGNRSCTHLCKKCNNIENQSLENYFYTQERVNIKRTLQGGKLEK